MRSRSAWVTVSSFGLAFVVAGCGGGANRRPPPELPHVLGLRLAREADAVARAPSGCEARTRAQELKNDVERSAARIPPALRAPIRRRAAELAERFACAPPPPAEEDHEKPEKAKKQKKHGKHHSHGKEP
jgi:hypothetical protein